MQVCAKVQGMQSCPVANAREPCLPTEPWNISENDRHMINVLTEDWHIAPYELALRKELGRGVFGRVLSGKWRNTTVAIKIAHPSPRDEPPSGGSPIVLRGLENNAHLWREVGMMMRVHHPHIVQYLGFSVLAANGGSVQPCIVMEFIDGGTLEAFIRKDLPSAAFCVSTRTKRRLCFEMTLAVEYLHGRRPAFITHRDLKPENFLLTQSLRVKLADFGISRLFDNSADPTASGAVHLPQNLDCTQTADCGTVRFMAPEVCSVKGMGVANGAMAALKPEDGAAGDNKCLNVGGTNGATVVARYSTAADIFSLGLVYYFVFEVREGSMSISMSRPIILTPTVFLIFSSSSHASCLLHASNRTVSSAVVVSIARPPCSVFCQNSRAACQPPSIFWRSGRVENRRSTAHQWARFVNSFGHAVITRRMRDHPRPRRSRCGRRSRQTRGRPAAWCRGAAGAQFVRSTHSELQGPPPRRPQRRWRRR